MAMMMTSGDDDDVIVEYPIQQHAIHGDDSVLVVSPVFV